MWMKFSHILGFDKPFPAHIWYTPQKPIWTDFWASEHSNGHNSKNGGVFWGVFIFSSRCPSTSLQFEHKIFLSHILVFFMFCRFFDCHTPFFQVFQAKLIIFAWHMSVFCFALVWRSNFSSIHTITSICFHDKIP